MAVKKEKYLKYLRYFAKTEQEMMNKIELQTRSYKLNKSFPP